MRPHFESPILRDAQRLICGDGVSRLVVVGFGSPLNPDQPNPKGLTIMAIGNIGQRVRLIARFLQADGTTPATVDGAPTWSVADTSIAEVREVDGAEYAYLLAEGSTQVEIHVDADRTAGIRELVGVGLIVVNDPATEAQTVELELSDAEYVPAEEPSAERA